MKLQVLSAQDIGIILYTPTCMNEHEQYGYGGEKKKKRENTMLETKFDEQTKPVLQSTV